MSRLHFILNIHDLIQECIHVISLYRVGNLCLVKADVCLDVIRDNRFVTQLQH